MIIIVKGYCSNCKRNREESSIEINDFYKGASEFKSLKDIHDNYQYDTENGICGDCLIKGI